MRASATGRCIACGDRPVSVPSRPGLSLVRSPGCGLEWREPLPDDAEIAALYGEGYLARWGAGDEGALARVREMKRRTYAPLLDEIVRLRPGGTLLDLGCAAGFLMELAAERGFDAYGLDLDPHSVELARRRFGDRVQQGSLDVDAFPGRRFDVVTLIDVFEHLSRPDELVEAVRARLAPGGLWVALMPNAASWVRRALGRRWPHYAPEHVFYWTPRSLGRFLAQRGWQLRVLRTGVRKTFTAQYLGAYSACLGGWLPPGLSLLGDRFFRAPTGEMLAIATPSPPAGASERAGSAAPGSPG